MLDFRDDPRSHSISPVVLEILDSIGHTIDDLRSRIVALKADAPAFPRDKEDPMQPSDIARVCHEVNRAYCASIGDHSQPAWDDAPEWQRKSAQTGVEFTIRSPNAKPSDSHESWLAEKMRDGWKYGPVKNPETKEHPCFVPYDELPIEQRTKDYLFQAVVRSLT